MVSPILIKRVLIAGKVTIKLRKCVKSIPACVNAKKNKTVKKCVTKATTKCVRI